jgi:SAM-dependent methyltransferase
MKTLFLSFLLTISSVRALADEAGLISHWLFSPDRRQGESIRALFGGQNARLNGSVRLINDPGPARLVLDGTDGQVLITDSLLGAVLPKEEMSVEAWVALDKPLTWGGIIGVIQDNGDYEHGWLLGYTGSAFSFAVSSSGKERLTYLKSSTSFEPGRWYHVAGTYDGKNLRIYVDGRLENSSTEQSGPISYPPSGFYEIGAYHDDDEYHRATGAIHEIRVLQRVLHPDEIAARYQAKKDLFPLPAPPPIFLNIALGPFADWVDRQTVEISWEVDEAMPTWLDFKFPSGEVRAFHEPAPKKLHRVRVNELKPDTEFIYQIKGPSRHGIESLSRAYEFDSTFYYEPARNPPSSNPYPEDEWTLIYERAAENIVRQSGITQGYCLVLGAREGRLAYELARRTEMQIVAVESDPAQVAAARKALDEAGLYGVRVSVHLGELDQLPYGPYFANLIVSDQMLTSGTLPEADAEKIFRTLRPSGGAAILGAFENQKQLNGAQLARWLAEGTSGMEVQVRERDGIWALIRRGALPGAGEWSHQYGHADNAACSQDELVQGELTVLWWGEPGPRPMPDRGNRNPAPLSVNGRMFVQGNRILFGMDAYNGTILWSFSNPQMRRANIPRDSSNMAATRDYLYLAQGGYCLGIEAQRGGRARKFAVPDHSAERPYDWGYVAALDFLLIGSGVKAGSSYLGDDGEWYEDFHPNQTGKVTSDSLFGYDQRNGELRWRYHEGAILNSTITIGDGVIYFIESRNPEARNSPNARVPNELLTDQHLVALDLRSGARLWEQAHDFSHCEFMTYMVYARDTLLVTGTDRQKKFHSYVFNAGRVTPAQGDAPAALIVPGQLLWQESHQEDKGHHSGHLQHPVIIGETFYSDQRAFELRTGKLIRTDLPERRGCGTMSASLNSLFFRHHFHGMWDLQTDRRTQFEGIRGGCWIGLIPAGGLLLAPESSAGCSCTHAIQTSVAYVPKAALGR